MMDLKERNFWPLPDDISLDDLVPRATFYRHLEERLDLSLVKESVRDRYAAVGRPDVDIVIFCRLQLVKESAFSKDTSSLERCVV
jgi:hypothetical protein